MNGKMWNQQRIDNSYPQCLIKMLIDDAVIVIVCNEIRYYDLYQ